MGAPSLSVPPRDARPVDRRSPLRFDDTICCAVPDDLYSLITYRACTVLGVVVFPHDEDLVIVLGRPDEFGIRVGMAARALANRLRQCTPRTAADIRTFAARQANEVRLSEPSPFAGPFRTHRYDLSGTVVERDGDGWTASLPAMAGAYSQGRTRAMALANLLDALCELEKARGSTLEPPPRVGKRIRA